jgi:hypothetical protein
MAGNSHDRGREKIWYWDAENSQSSGPEDSKKVYNTIITCKDRNNTNKAISHTITELNILQYNTMSSNPTAYH